MTLSRAVRTYLDHLAVERGLAANTLSSYRRDLARYDEFLAGQGIDDLDAVTEATVAAFLVSLREGSEGHPPLSATSAARERTMGSAMPQPPPSWCPETPAASVPGSIVKR